MWLGELGRQLGRPATLDDVPNAGLDSLASWGFRWVYLLSVWQTGSAGRHVSLTNPEWRREFQQALPDLRDDDIIGSGFAIADYRASAALGGDAGLANFRRRLHDRGLRLMLDFVPNHTALDHAWVARHPDYYIQGSESDLAAAPQNFVRLNNRVFAYGRDPYFAGWPDTVQLAYSNPAVREAMTGTLERLAGQCDGVRCDMAMLVLPDVFERTWGRKPEPFWPTAIERVRRLRPEFCFLAEVYWDLEWELQQLGFDFCYDKRLYDRLRDGHAGPVRDHLRAGLDYQSKLARFLENHDEPRAAAAFPPDRHEAAAVIAFLAPGLRFFHEGQFAGRTVRISPHLGRRPNEPVNERMRAFYRRLLAVLKRPAACTGDWQMLETSPAWDGNPTHSDFIIFDRRSSNGRLMAVVNYADHASQCRVRLDNASAGSWHFQNLLDDAAFDPTGGDLPSSGWLLDLPAWGRAVYDITPDS